MPSPFPQEWKATFMENTVQILEYFRSDTNPTDLSINHHQEQQQRASLVFGSDGNFLK